MAGFSDLNKGDSERDKLPLEHFTLDGELKPFLDILLLTETVKEQTNHMAAVKMSLDRKKVQMSLGKEFDPLPIPQQMYVLAHEAAHLLLNHLLRTKRIDDPKKMNIAQDAVLNTLINKHYQQWLDMPRDAKTGQEQGLTIDTIKPQLDDNLPKPPEEMTSEELYGHIKGKGGDGEGEPGKNPIDDLDGRRIDDHDPHFNADELDPETEEQINQIFKAMKNDTYGDRAGNFARDIEAVVKKSFPFDRILNKIIYKAKPDWHRPNRRIQDPAIFLPRKRVEKFKVYVGMDVSGSCYDYTEDFLGYVAALPEFEEAKFCDTQICGGFKKGEGIPRTVPGGGGTDLNPLFKWFREVEDKARGQKINFIVLTDGEIPPLTIGPVRNKVIILTTNDPVIYEPASRNFHNINISVDM